jgi:hypothetical protein
MSLIPEVMGWKFVILPEGGIARARFEMMWSLLDDDDTVYCN